MKFGEAGYRLREIGVSQSNQLSSALGPSSGSANIFQDRNVLDPSDTMLAMERLAWMAMDAEMPLKALPLLALMDYLATDVVCSPFYSMRAKLMRATALAHCGFINEAYQMLQRAFNERDLPVAWLPRQSEFVKREKGSTWFFNSNSGGGEASNSANSTGGYYNNNGYPFTEKNREIIEILLKKMADSMAKFFPQRYGQLNVNLLTYARLLLVFTINENEIFDENNDRRIENLNAAEKQLRDLLRKIAFEEELDYLYYQLSLHRLREDAQISAADRQKDEEAAL